MDNKRKKFESCVDSLRLSEVSALHVRTKRSLIRAGVTPGGAERLFSQLATLTLITLTVHHHPPLCTLHSGDSDSFLMKN